MRSLVVFIVVIVLVIAVVRTIRRLMAELTGPRGPFRPEQEYAADLDLAPNPSPEQVRKAYREMIGKYHPDRVHHLGGEFQKLAEQKSKRINEAYQYFRRKYRL